MKILHINQYGTHRGGVEGYIADVSRALRAVGHDATLAYFEPHKSTDLLPGATRLAADASLDGLIAQLDRLIREIKPDVAYIHAIYQPQVVSWIAKTLPTLAYVHGPYLVCPGFTQYFRRSRVACPRRSGAGCLLKAQTERCCFGRNPVGHLRRLQDVLSFIDIYSQLPILVGSVFMRDLLLRNGLVSEKISVLAPVLISTAAQTPQTISDPRQILFSGRLVPEKGLELLLDALTHIDRPWKLQVAGDGPERPRLEALIRENGLHDRVSFLGWCDEVEMEQLYAQSAFVVFPSLWPEPFGRVGPEAAKHGRPVIAFDVGGVRDWLEDGVTGYVIPAKDVDALADCIQRLLDDPQRQHQLGRRAYETAMGRWSELTHVQQLVEHFDNVIMQPPGPKFIIHNPGELAGCTTRMAYLNARDPL